MSSSLSEPAATSVAIDDRPPVASVIIATYARPALIARLLGQLAHQHVDPASFEVVVVDDGSPEPVAPALAALQLPFRLTLLRQPNGGPGSARRRAIAAARGDILIVVDDDMEVGGDFVGAHLRAHADGEHRVVLGRVRHAPASRGSLTQRYHMAKLARAADRSRSGRPLSGAEIYTGNVSLRRDDYVAAGGFDPSFRVLEDADLGIRLEQAGATVVVSEEAASLHEIARLSLREWMPYAVDNGRAAARVAAKQPEVDAANPWRYLFHAHRLFRPALVTSALMPRLARAGSWVVAGAAHAADALGAERVAIAATTFVYGIRFYAGVRDEDGSAGRTMRRLARHLNSRDAKTLGWAAKIGKLGADILADHDALRAQDEKYRGRLHSSWSLPFDAMRNVGFQMMVAFRVMKYLRWVHLTPLAMIQARLMRHIYASDIHWDADIQPGVVIVHGYALGVSKWAHIEPGCMLFQGVSIGENGDPLMHHGGAPYLEHDVQVMPGAVVVGPIRVGAGSKIVANAVLMQSVPPRSIVEPAAVVVRQRRGGRPHRPRVIDETGGEVEIARDGAEPAVPDEPRVHA